MSNSTFEDEVIRTVAAVLAMTPKDRAKWSSPLISDGGVPMRHALVEQYHPLVSDADRLQANTMYDEHGEHAIKMQTWKIMSPEHRSAWDEQRGRKQLLAHYQGPDLALVAAAHTIYLAEAEAASQARVELACRDGEKAV